QQDIVGEAYWETAPALQAYMPPLIELSEAELSYFTQDDESALLRLAERLSGRKAPASGSTPGRLRTMLHGNRLVDALQKATELPRSLSEITDVLYATLPELAGFPVTSSQRLVEAYLLMGSIGDDSDPPLLRPKLHSFFHGVYDVGLCMN